MAIGFLNGSDYRPQNETQAAYKSGFEAGQSEEYGAFWDAYQKRGSRTDYQYAFYGPGWNTRNLKPKYNIIPKTETMCMFKDTQIEGDLAQICADAGIVIDFSQATKFEYVFQNAKFTRIGEIDAYNANRFNQVFFNCKNLETIDHIIMSEMATFSNPFMGCTNLKNVIFDGVIGQTGLSFSSSNKLTRDSLTSIMRALDLNYTLDDEDNLIVRTITLSKEAVNKAFETGEGMNDGEGNMDWIQMCMARMQWNIVLI